jgi:two-component system, NtrC family, sensor histidine kinase HydH
MPANRKTPSNRFDKRIQIVSVLTPAVLIFILTWIAIRESRNDSYSLLQRQGEAFTNALAEAASNAIAAEANYDRLVQKRYSDLVSTVLDFDLRKVTVDQLAGFAQDHDLRSVFLFKRDSTMVAGASISGDPATPPAFVKKEIESLIAQPENKFTQLLDHDDKTDEDTQYFLEIANTLDYVVVVAADARYYSEAIRETGIGFLAQRMAQEPGVEYIIYQTTDGIIFSSRPITTILSIESDPFLYDALQSDSVTARQYTFQDQQVLEIVKPFTTAQYPYGLFRVGVSLDKYYAVSRGYDIQMILVSIILVTLATLSILYLSSRQKRRLISQQYSDIKSLNDRIFEQMRVGLAVIGDDGLVRAANAAMDRALGKSALVGKYWNEIIGIDELKTDAMAAAGQSIEKEVAYQTSTETKSLLVAASQVKLEESGSFSAVVIVYDVTRLRTYERDAVRRERLSEMGNLAAGVAHEIRNPLNTISIAAQRLAAEFSPQENKEEYAEFTSRIREETRRLNDIITRFLALARDEGKKRKRLDLAIPIDRFASLVNAESAASGITLTTEVSGIVQVEADPDEIHQLLLNLFNNAKEALGGKPGRLAICLADENNQAVLRFEDSGPGIPTDLRAQVFAPYFTTKESGTGLGLATAHRIVTGMSGTIAVVDSTLGGACFEIRLPAVSPQ